MQIGTHGFRRLDLDRAGCEDTVEQRAAHEESDPEEEPSHSGSSVEDCSDGHEPRRQVVDGVEEGIHSLSEEGQGGDHHDQEDGQDDDAQKVVELEHLVELVLLDEVDGVENTMDDTDKRGQSSQPLVER